MDRSADPCTDFDRYVCGRFNDDAIIPDKKHMHDLTTTGYFPWNLIHLFLINWLYLKMIDSFHTN